MCWVMVCTQGDMVCLEDYHGTLLHVLRVELSVLRLFSSSDKSHKARDKVISKY